MYIVWSNKHSVFLKHLIHESLKDGHVNININITADVTLLNKSQLSDYRFVRYAQILGEVKKIVNSNK